MALLVRTPSAFPSESIWGYLLRVTEANGYTSPRTILDLAGITTTTHLGNAGPTLKKLAAVLGMTPEDLRPIARVWPDESATLQVMQHELGPWARKGGLARLNPGFCPACVEDHGFIDAFWDIAVAGACPHHGLIALRTCPGCGQDLGWLREGMLRCRCGVRLGRRNCAPADTKTVELMGLAHAKLHRMPLAAKPNTSKFPIEWIDKASTSSVLQVIRIVGAAAIESSVYTHPGVAAGASECLADWPRGFNKFLQEYGNRQLSKRPHASGLCAQFSPLYWALFRNPELTEFDLFRDQFMEFACTEWPHAVLDARVLRTRTNQNVPRYITQAEFMRRYRIVKPVMKRLIKDGTLVTQLVQRGPSKLVAIDVEKSKMPVDDGAEPVRWSKVAKWLGLPMRVIEAMREQGTLPTKIRPGHTSTWYREDLDDFLKKGLALASGPTRSKHAAQLGKILRMRGTHAAKADIVAAVFDGRLAVLGRVGKTLGGLQLNRRDALALVVGKREHQGGATCSIAEAARRCGLTYEVMNSAFKQRLLDTRRVNGNTHVTSESIGRFREEYVPLNVLAKDLGTSPAHLRRIAESKKIEITELSRNYGTSMQALIPARDQQTVLSDFAGIARRRRSRGDVKSEQVEVLRGYLAGLEADDSRLPRRAGQPNKAAIARACNFGRMVLYDVPAAARLLEEFDAQERLPPGRAPVDAVAKVRAYVACRQSTGEAIPIWGSNPNVSRISTTLGLDRNLFRTKPELMRILRQACK